MSRSSQQNIIMHAWTIQPHILPAGCRQQGRPQSKEVSTYKKSSAVCTEAGQGNVYFNLNTYFKLHLCAWGVKELSLQCCLQSLSLYKLKMFLEAKGSTDKSIKALSCLHVFTFEKKNLKSSPAVFSQTQNSDKMSKTST